MGRDGEPDPDNYRFDGLHLSTQGYSVWRDIIRPRLLDELEAPHKSKALKSRSCHHDNYRPAPDALEFRVHARWRHPE
ncbi:MAG: hypothetical protein IPG06_22345 [Haliea sp.]|nr:hypothetical protein [Haliea sp.]